MQDMKDKIASSRQQIDAICNDEMKNYNFSDLRTVRHTFTSGWKHEGQLAKLQMPEYLQFFDLT